MKFPGYRLTQNPAEAKQPESKKRHSYTKELKQSVVSWHF